MHRPAIRNLYESGSNAICHSEQSEESLEHPGDCFGTLSLAMTEWQNEGLVSGKANQPQRVIASEAKQSSIPEIFRSFHSLRITSIAQSVSGVSIIIIITILLVLSPGLSAQTTKTENEVYGPVVSGFFYPRAEDKLQKMITTLLDKATKQEIQGRPVALISPHAGYDYSGGVAAHGYRAIKGKDYKRVVVLAPSHYGKRYRGVAVLKASRYKTPLGEIEIDTEVCNELVNNSPPLESYKLIDYSTAPYKNEHSIETQLPFLQTVLGEFKLVPLLVGLLMDDDYSKVADAIKPYIDDSTLIVASTDFTHYGRRFNYVPFFTEIEKKIKDLDYGAIDQILEMDFDGFVGYRKKTGITVCGFMPVAVLIKLLSTYTDVQGTVLKYDTSGRMVEDFSHSVSYASIIFTAPTGKKTGKALKLPVPDRQTVLVADPPEGGRRATGGEVLSTDGHTQTPGLITDEEGEVLLGIARYTLETYTRTKELPEIAEDHLTPKLRKKSGVFVTLKKNGMLRGCIGH
ncbi:MAG: AmmeMemoRadiSam system protein B, partial [Candidatus Brocadiales bacterium]